MIIVPIPVLYGTMVLSSWARTDPHFAARPNHVFRCLDDEAGLGSARQLPVASKNLTDRCIARARAIEEQLGHDHEIVVNAPFVLAGNVQREALWQYLSDTIEPAMVAMRSNYFSSPITEPVTVLLFADEGTYRTQALRLFGQRHVPIYGYYKPANRTIVINLGAGDGTILHELTHALMDFDCPQAALWINEGLASLHEESRIEPQGSELAITPLLNWRLDVLQRAIIDQKLRPSRELMMMPTLMGNDEAINYAHARYFCMYLNELGLLQSFYRSYRNQSEDDPTGVRTLESFGIGGYQLDQEFQAWVMQLRLPRS